MKNLKFLLKFSYPVFAALMLSHCGSGSGTDAEEDTVRPKSLDDITLTLDGSIQFDFISNMDSGRAVRNGDEEFGTFIYRPAGTGFRKYPNILGTVTNTDWPARVNGASYRYRAINSTSGIITLFATGSGGRPSFTGISREPNGSQISFFRYTSPIFELNETRTLVLDVTFGSNGAVVSSNEITANVPESPEQGLDTIRIPSSVMLTSGGPVPVNYGTQIDPNRPSRIVPESLDRRLLVATNGIPLPSLDFTLQFTKDATQPTFGTGANTEIGQALLRVVSSPIDSAADYTWQRIPGTDTGTLTLSNSGSALFDRAFTLNFIGVDSGTYAGGTAQTSGTFTLAPNP